MHADPSIQPHTHSEFCNRSLREEAGYCKDSLYIQRDPAEVPEQSGRFGDQYGSSSDI